MVLPGEIGLAKLVLGGEEEPPHGLESVLLMNGGASILAEGPFYKTKSS